MAREDDERKDLPASGDKDGLPLRRDISRRDFLKIAAGASGAVIGAGMLLPVLGRPAEAISKYLDTPTIRCVGATQHTIFLEVCAGASGAPAGFSLFWVKHADYPTLTCGTGGIWPGGCKGTFSVTGDCGTYSLAPNTCVVVEAGNLRDAECFVAITRCGGDELECGTEYVFRARAEATADKGSSDLTVNVCCATESCVTGCVRTQGYWRNHAAAWPVSSLMIGSLTYSQTDLLANLGLPGFGNAVIILSHQLIAAKLNRAAGASGSSQVSDPLDPGNPYNGMTVDDIIATADGLIGSMNINSDSVAPRTTLGHQMTAASRLLDLYNNGDGGVPHCPD